MSLLTIIQEVCLQIGMPKPGVVEASDDIQAQQMISLVNLEGNILSRRFGWQALDMEATFVTLAAEDQGAIETIAPGFRYLINETIWNRDQQDPIEGPLSPKDWQLLKASAVTGPYPNYRIKGGHLYLLPIPAAGDNAYFEYRSKYWATDSGGTPKAAMTLDDDVSVLDELLLQMGLAWRFLKAKGLDYGELFSEYQREVNNAMAHDGGKRRLWLDAGDLSERGRTASAPEGSWPL